MVQLQSCGKLSEIMALCPSAVFDKGKPYADEEPLFAGHGFNVYEAAFEYRPRRPEESVLYGVVAGNIKSFRIGRSLLPPLWRKDESLVCNKFADGDSKDSDLSRISDKSSSHSICRTG
jgi:hypothetical protein